MRAFPQAKVVLTVREPASWYRSVRDTIHGGRDQHRDLACSLLSRLSGLAAMTGTVDRVNGTAPPGMDKSE